MSEDVLKYKDFFSRSAAEVIDALGSDPEGLSDEEAKRRLQQYGENITVYGKPEWKQILLRQVRSYFVYLLFAASLINLFLGEYVDSTLIFLFILISVVLGFYQEYRAERAIFDLKKFLMRFVRVRRNGEAVSRLAEELVPGDVILLKEGDLIPADIRIIRASRFLVNESVLTGESMPQEKHSQPISPDNVSSDLEAGNICFFGTSVVGGWASAVVLKSGVQTYFGRVFEDVSHIERPSLFERNIKNIARALSILVTAMAFLVLAAKFLIEGTVTLSFIIFVIALVIAVVPEALPLVVTLAFSRGALSLAKKHVVVKRLTALDDLGNINVLCTDKTGTITKNELAATSWYGADEKELFELAALGASDVRKFGKVYDPFDLALFKKIGPQAVESLKSVEVIDSLPFDPIRRVNSLVLKFRGKFMLISRGAPENILNGAAYIRDRKGKRKIRKSDKEAMLEWFKRRGQMGERVLAVSYKEVRIPPSNLKEEERRNMVFMGLIAFSDPLKDSSREASILLRRLDIDLKIVTGDSKEVAGAVGYKLGLIRTPDDVMTGMDFEALDEARRKEAVQKHNVFARTLPEHKLHIIEALRENHAVAFLGEGFNDIPALRRAHVSFVVRDATDMAKISSDIVLLENDLSVIARGIEEGRKLFVNVMKYIKITLSASLGNFFSMVIASFALPFLPILPVQVLLVNLLSDMPMVSIFADNVQHTEIKFPERYNLRSLYLFIVVFGLISSFFDLIFFGIFRQFGEHILQTSWFVLSILTEVAAFLTLRTVLPLLKSNMPAAGTLIFSAAAVIFTVLFVAVPVLSAPLNFVRLSFMHWMFIVSIVGGYFLVNELAKLLYNIFVRSRYWSV